MAMEDRSEKQRSMDHQKFKQEAVKYSCEQCDYKATKGNLLTHIKSIHEGVKFPCGQCDYKAKWKKALLTHMKSTHEGVKFPCEQCDYKATEKGNLLRHIKLIHAIIESTYKVTITSFFETIAINPNIGLIFVYVVYAVKCLYC